MLRLALSQRALRQSLPGLALLLAAAVLYLLTLGNGLQPYQLAGGDLVTHQYAQVQGRFSNAPGYPLYTMGGWLWFHLGRLLLGAQHNPVPILSSYSTLWALVTLWLLYRLILDVTDRGQGGNRPVAFLASAFYGVTYFFWFYAVSTEQYTSAVAWTLAVVWLAFRWERTRRDTNLLWLALLAGVALAHMLTLVFIVPPLLWFILSRDPRLLRRPRLLAAAALLVALPLLSYAYVYVRGAQHPEWRGAGSWPSTWAWFWDFISTGQGRSELTWSWRPFFTSEYPALIWRELTWPALIAGVLGVAALGKRRAGLIYVTLVIYMAFCWIDRLGNWYQVIMPAYALLALGLAAGVDWLWHLQGPTSTASSSAARVESLALPISTKYIRIAILFFLVLLVLYRGATSYPRADMRDRPDATALAPGWAILADQPAPNTTVLGTLPEKLALDYLTQVWGVRPDVRAVTSDQARGILAAGSPPLAVTEAALPLVRDEISAQAHFSALGRTLVSVRSSPLFVAQVPADLLPWQETFGEGLRLAGAAVTHNQATGELVVRLVWQAEAAPERDLSVSVRLLQDGREIAQLDHGTTVLGAYPTTRWIPGEVVSDAFPFVVPSGSKPNGVRVILYYREVSGGYANVHSATFALPTS